MFQDFPTPAPAAAPVKQANIYPSPPLQRPMPEPVYLQRPLQQQQQQHHHRPQANLYVMPENAMSWQQEIEIMCRDLLHR